MKIRDFFSKFSLPAWLDCALVRVVFALMFFIFGGAYIFKTGGLIASGYEIKKLEEKIESLNSEIRKIETDVASESAIQNIQGKVGDLKMVAAPNVQYLNAVGSFVAKK